MTILSYLNKLVKRASRAKPTLEYIQEAPTETNHVETDVVKSEDLWEMDNDIDLSPQTDLEGYARRLNISKESIERWISSGLLMPEELKVAEKIVKIMRKH